MIGQDELQELAVEYNVDTGAYDENYGLLKLLIRVHNAARAEALAGKGQAITFTEEEE